MCKRFIRQLGGRYCVGPCEGLKGGSMAFVQPDEVVEAQEFSTPCKASVVIYRMPGS